MGKNTDNSCDETDPVALVEEADRKGKVSIVKGIMNDPEVQGIIKESLLRETIKNTVIMSCLLIGLLKLYEVLKTVTGFDWRGDLCISVVLIFIGLVYTLRSLLCSSKHTNRKS